MKETVNTAGTETKDKNTIVPTVRTELLKKVGIFAGIALIAFLLGFIPMWLSARGYENERDQVLMQLRPSRLQNDLATAAIYARRGEFEQARQQSSDFYSALRAEFESDQTYFKTEDQRRIAQQILDGRDETITSLARNDAAAADRLSDIYFAFTQTKGVNAPTGSPK